MREIVLTPAAKRDLGDIWDYSAQQWGVDRAETYVRDLWAAILPVAAEPGMAQFAGEVRPDYRRWKCGAHVIFFKSNDTEIDVIRILHQARDFDCHL